MNEGNLSCRFVSYFKTVCMATKAPDRGMIRRSRGGFALIPGCDPSFACIPFMFLTTRNLL